MVHREILTHMAAKTSWNGGERHGHEDEEGNQFLFASQSNGSSFTSE